MHSPLRLATLYFSPLFLVTAIWALRQPSSAAVDRQVSSLRGRDWLPPAWLPGDEALAIEALDRRGPSEGPSLRARSALVFDLDRHEVLFEKRADDRRPVASLTKMVSALALVASEPDLDGYVCIDAEEYPSRSGAVSRMRTGDCLTGWEVLGAAMVSSDNRAAYAMAEAAGLSVLDFVGRMNEVSLALRMDQSSWTEPSGLEDEDISTARDMARATIALAAHPDLAMVSSAPSWDISRKDAELRRLFTTNKLIERPDLVVEAAKTGFSETADYCFSTLVQTRSGRRLVVTVLGADGKMSRFRDVDRVLDWVEG
jgi:D-alanyl-D-alanine endopeptidase (penicillin-binding protein 7)